ncbi:immunoglobulin-like domain-containing protein, partial [Alicyclobacillus fodiniaquatilis]
ADKAALAIGYAAGDSASNVTQNLTLPTTGSNGSTISWSSDTPTVVANDGTVTQPAYSDGNATVTLTATITKGSASDTQTFTVTVVQAALTPVNLNLSTAFVNPTSGSASSTTFVVRVTLKDSEGNTLGSGHSVTVTPYIVSVGNLSPATATYNSTTDDYVCSFGLGTLTPGDIDFNITIDGQNYPYSMQPEATVTS